MSSPNFIAITAATCPAASKISRLEGMANSRKTADKMAQFV